MFFRLNNYRYSVFFALSMYGAVFASDRDASVAVQAVSTSCAKVSLLMCAIEQNAGEVSAIADIIKRDLEFSGQFTVAVEKKTVKPSKKDIKQAFTNGYQLALYLSPGKNSRIEWRLYDTQLGKMVKGKRYAKRGESITGWAHNIADSVWPFLTQKEGFFSTRIAYCKAVQLSNGKNAKHVYMAEYDGSNEQLLVGLPTVSIAPRWNGDVAKPLLFYSEYTNSNVRLVSVDMKKIRRIASNFDGINMLPAFSRDGKKVVYCASKDEAQCQLYYSDKNGFKKLTSKGNNISPSLSDDGNAIYYCSDEKAGNPQVYVHHLKTGSTERITKDGYCASPSYCEKRKQVAYTKIVKGTMQLFLYDEVSKKHTQVTSDTGNKQECCWSPCGNYISYAIEMNGLSRIAVLNTLTHTQRYITDAACNCSYPAWSPVYNQFPVIIT